MQGGLGLRNQDAVHSSAYISSIVSCIYNLSKTFPEYIKTDGPQNSFIFIGFASHINYLNELNTYNNERINNPDLIPPNPPTEDKLINTLINATNLCLSGVGTFGIAAALLSPNLKRLYYTSLYMKSHLNPEMVDFQKVEKIEYKISNYLKIGEWFNSKENVDSMLDPRVLVKKVT